MPLRSAALAALLVLLLSAAPAGAEEPATAVSPKEAYAAKAASLPAPSAANAFRFDGVLRLNGKTMGHATLFAAPDPKDPAIWRAGDQLVIKTAAAPRIEIAEAWFNRMLVPLRGAVESTDPADARVTWVKTEQGFRGTATTKEGEVGTEKVRNFEHRGSATTTLSGTILFARMALPTKATYATTIFEAENAMKGKPALHAARIDVLGEQELQGKQVLVVRAQKGAQKLELLFKAEGRELVAVRFEEGEQRIEILKGDVWSMPARSPVIASLRAALAFGTGNVELLDDVIYWPRFYKSVMDAQIAAGSTAKPPSMDAFRANLLEQWKQKLPKNPAAMIQGVLKQMPPQLKETKLANGDVEVLYPPAFRNLKLTLGKQFGFWHLVALPGTGKPAPAAAKDEAPPKQPEAPKDSAPGK